MQEGKQPAPQFYLRGVDEKGEISDYSLESLLEGGRYLVLYFYPKDDTPGCTREACDFRDNIGLLKRTAAVAGVSADRIETHLKFHARHGLPFPILSDPDKKVIGAYGKICKRNLSERIFAWFLRSTFIISPDRRVIRSWHRLSSRGHVSEVITELDRLDHDPR